MSKKIYNRPGLSAIGYRAGTHPTILKQMLAQLPLQELADGQHSGTRPLAGLTTRSIADPAVALLDACAVTADVLTFYQERIANEGFLRTATERFSVLELARSIGYELSPGVAAATYLAFTVEDAPGAPTRVTVPAGTRVQSVPPQGEQPQTFETLSELVARVEWNAAKAETSRPIDLTKYGLTALYFQGTATRLQPGDGIVIIGEEWSPSQSPYTERWDFRILKAVEPDAASGVTRVAWDKPLGAYGTPGQKNPHVFALRQRAALFGAGAAEWNALPTDFKNNYAGGHPGTEWPNFEDFGTAAKVPLDGAYPKIVPDSWLVARTPGGSAQLFRVQKAEAGSLAQFAVSGKATWVTLHKAIGEFTQSTTLYRRELQLFAESEELAVAEKPLIRPVAGVLTVTEPVHGAAVTLQAPAPVPERGRPLIVTGKRIRVRVQLSNLKLTPDDGTPDLHLAYAQVLTSLAAPVRHADGQVTWHLRNQDGVTGTVTCPQPDDLALIPADEKDELVSEPAFVQEAVVDGARLKLTLQSDLANWYDPATTRVSLNAAPATHGETVREVLGGGDAMRPGQRVTLKKPPLTYVPAATAGGARSTLTVRVGDVAWAEQPSLYGLAPDDQAYTVRISDDGKPTVIFGDGKRGALPFSGQENITATYRSGTGAAGNLPGGSLTTLLSRPPGLRSVTNPVAATGGADPEHLADARVNAPLRVLTLDRIVSLQDYADFARAFAGIVRARADAIWAGQQRVVQLSVLGTGGAAVDPASAVYQSLAAAIRRYGDPTRRARIESGRVRTFGITAAIFIDAPRYEPEQVLAAVETVLRQAFAFEQRDLTQHVTAAGVLAVMHAVPGVVAVDLDKLDYDQREAADPPAAGGILTARPARWEGSQVRPAELLVLGSKSVSLRQGVKA